MRPRARDALRALGAMTDRIPVVGDALRGLVALGRLEREVHRAHHAAALALLAAVQRTGEARGRDPPDTDPPDTDPTDTDPTVPLPERLPRAGTSRACIEAELTSAAYRAWCRRFRAPPVFHRKRWEHAFLADELSLAGALRPGARGLGFGVGKEPLVAVFAALGCQIVATDLPADADEARAWARTNQHAGGFAALNEAGICPPQDFAARVSFRPVDMRRVPDELRGFDFLWSSCALEHLGSLAAGLAFVRETLACLKPGGVAVHTTELNASSDDDTIGRGPTALYRARDLRALCEELRRAGHAPAPLDLDLGRGLLDRYVDVTPYLDEPHLKLSYMGFTTTSVGLVIRRGP